MKRFLFWFLAAGAAVMVLRSSHDRHRRDIERPVFRTLVIHRDSGGHEHPGRQVVRIEGNGQLIQIRDSAHADENDDDDAHGLVEVEGLPVPIERGTRVTEARPEPPKPPAPPRPPAPGVRRLRPPKPPALPRPPRPPSWRPPSRRRPPSRWRAGSRQPRNGPGTTPASP
ncbi:MAG: hypothetical protein U0835_26085 [Isosphaeraceae bacterium]